MLTSSSQPRLYTQDKLTLSRSQPPSHNGVGRFSDSRMGFLLERAHQVMTCSASCYLEISSRGQDSMGITIPTGWYSSTHHLFSMPCQCTITSESIDHIPTWDHHWTVAAPPWDPPWILVVLYSDAPWFEREINGTATTTSSTSYCKPMHFLLAIEQSLLPSLHSSSNTPLSKKEIIEEVAYVYKVHAHTNEREIIASTAIIIALLASQPAGLCHAHTLTCDIQYHCTQAAYHSLSVPPSIPAPLPSNHYDWNFNMNQAPCMRATVHGDPQCCLELDGIFITHCDNTSPSQFGASCLCGTPTDLRSGLLGPLTSSLLFGTSLLVSNLITSWITLCGHYNLWFQREATTTIEPTSDPHISLWQQPSSSRNRIGLQPLTTSHMFYSRVSIIFNTHAIEREFPTTTTFLHAQKPAGLLQQSLSIDIMTSTTHPTTDMNATVLRIIQRSLILCQALYNHVPEDPFKLVIELTPALYSSELPCLLSTKHTSTDAPTL